MANVLVTGHTGFVGKHIVDTLVEKHQLKLLGRKQGDASGEFFYGEFNDSFEYKEALSGVDVIVHVAGRAHVMEETESDPIQAYREVNTRGTLNLARQAIKAGVKRFIFFSTIKVNGESTEDSKPFTSSSTPNPTDPYSISKYEAEEGLLALAEGSGMEVVIIRPPLIYGEGVKGNFASLMKLTKRAFPLPLRLVTKNRRSLVSVYNLVDLVSFLIDSSEIGNVTLLVSDDEDLSTSEMIALMASVQGVPNLSLPVPTFALNFIATILGKKQVAERLLGSLTVDIQHTKDLLGWKPPYSVKEGFGKSFYK